MPDVEVFKNKRKEKRRKEKNVGRNRGTKELS